jgi:uncharacterized protein
MSDNIYIKSNYNIFLDNFVIFNLISKNYLQLNESLYSYLKRKNKFAEKDLEGVLDKLLNANIITQDNELLTLDYLYNSLKFDRTKASYIIYPTLTCNFNCNYCFETTKKESLNDSKTIILKNFLTKQTKLLSELSIRWSGGEPLIVWEKIKKITESIIKSDPDLKYNFSLATNGYFITKQIVKELNSLNFSSLQITVDGTRDEHNKIRYTKYDNDTYSSVINGIKIASQKLKVIIRFNVNKDNVSSFDDFLLDLQNHSVNNENIEIFVKPIRPKQDSSFCCDLINDSDFNKNELAFYEIAKNKGFKYSIHPNFNSNLRCLFHHINSFVIDPNLNLYKCAAHVSLNDKKVGIINNSEAVEITNLKYFIKTLSYSPIAIKECRDCSVLPICFGKCPLIWDETNQPVDIGCIPDKVSYIDKFQQLFSNEK